MSPHPQSAPGLAWPCEDASMRDLPTGVVTILFTHPW